MDFKVSLGAADWQAQGSLPKDGSIGQPHAIGDELRMQTTSSTSQSCRVTTPRAKSKVEAACFEMVVRSPACKELAESNGSVPNW